MNKSILSIAVVRDQSRIVEAKSIPPLKMLFPQLDTEFSTAVLSSYGGGTLQGDCVCLDVNVGTKAKLFLGNQAWTRLYKNEKGEKARFEISGTMEKKSQAYVFPEFTIPQAKSDFENIQNWKLGPGALLFLVDGFVAGRIQNGEVFKYARYKSEIKVYQQNKLILKDVFVSEPEIDFPRLNGNFGANLGYVNGYLIGEPESELFQKLKTSLRDLFDIRQKNLSEEKTNTHISFDSPQDNVIVTRAVGETIQPLKDWTSALSGLLKAENLLGMNPLERKY